MLLVEIARHFQYVPDDIWNQAFSLHFPYFCTLMSDNGIACILDLDFTTNNQDARPQ